MTIQDSSTTITRSAKRFFSGTAISRMTGLVREVGMAAAFGTHPVVAAFWMAFRFANLLRRLFGEGALNAAFVPHFESLRKQDSSLAARFFYDLTMGVTFLLLVPVLASQNPNQTHHMSYRHSHPSGLRDNTLCPSEDGHKVGFLWRPSDCEVQWLSPFACCTSDFSFPCLLHATATRLPQPPPFPPSLRSVPAWRRWILSRCWKRIKHPATPQ